MAQHRIFEITDDFDGKPADETIEFSLDGQPYLIDLSTANAKKLRTVMAPYIKVARPHDKRYRLLDVGYREVRQWAKARGIPVSDRGRVAFEVMEQYKQAKAKTDSKSKKTVKVGGGR